jgi:hypothetical protein
MIVKSDLVQDPKKEKHSNRPSASQRWPHPCSMKLTPSKIEYGTTNARGSIHRTAFAGKPATVVLGKKLPENGEIIITPTDCVWTVTFNGRGLMSSIGSPGVGITILV